MASETGAISPNNVSSILVASASATTETLKVYGDPTTHSAYVYLAGGVSGGVAVKTAPLTSVTNTNVSVAATNFTVFSANSSARSRTVWNDGTANVKVKFGATATASSFDVVIAPNGYYEFPLPLYTGIVDAIGDSASGSLRVSEGT